MVVGTKQLYDYAMCDACGSLSIVTIPDALSELYRDYPEDPEEKSGWFNRLCKRVVLSKSGWTSKLAARFLSSWGGLRVRALHPYPIDRSTRLLDVGCGSGEFVRELISFGYENCRGIDPYLERTAPYLEHRGIFEMDSEWDVITFHHTFEHMENPRDVIEKAGTLLAPGGLAIIRIPNVESASFRRFGASWSGIHAPYHLALPSRRGIESLIRDTPLRSMEVRPEQSLSFLLMSVNYSRGITDFAEDGIRTFIGRYPRCRFLYRLPPGYSRREIGHWKKVAHRQSKSLDADFVNHYFRKQ